MSQKIGALNNLIHRLVSLPPAHREYNKEVETVKGIAASNNLCVNIQNMIRPLLHPHHRYLHPKVESRVAENARVSL